MKELRNDMTHDVITYKGIKNHYTEQNFTFIALTKLTQKDLKEVLSNTLSVYNYNPINGDGYVYAPQQNCPVLLIAHMDTTPTVGGATRVPVKDFYEEEVDGKHIIASPQGIGGDDRCGVFTILQILRETNFRPAILFCEDEEVGCIGSQKFCKTELINEVKKLNFMVQIDRRGNHDLVFYDDGNYDWHDWCEQTTGWEEAYGSCSDISFIAPESGVAAVNISSGYYDEHTLYESVVMEEVRSTIDCVKKFLQNAEGNKFEYVATEVDYGNGWYRYYGYDYDDYGYYNREGKRVTYGGMWILFETPDGKQDEDYIEGQNMNECFGVFFQAHGDVCYNNILDYEMY